MRSLRGWPSQRLCSGILMCSLSLLAVRPSYGQPVSPFYSLANFMSWLPGAAAQTTQPSTPTPANTPPAVTPPTPTPPTPTPPTPTPPTPANVVTPAPPLTYDDCLKVPRTASPADGNEKLKVLPNPATRWQPVGGKVRFTISGRDLSPGPFQAVGCFGWETGDPGKQEWHWGVPLEVLDIKNGEITLGAVLPDELGNTRIADTLSEGLGIVPLADLRILARGPGTSGAWKEFDVSIPVGVTHRWGALLIAGFFIGLAWWSVLRLAKMRPTIRGGPLLRMIANENGYASLSQLQITLWTFVIAGGAMYVMALSGALIDIPTQALTLLGISGVAVLGASLPGATASSGPAAPENAASTPGMVTTLTTVSVVNSTSVVLAWRAPAIGKQAVAYTVERSVGAAWTQIAGTRDLFLAITDLTAGTSYQFRVTAVDANGTPGVASPPISVTTPVAPFGAAPAAPTNVVAAVLPDSQGESQIAVNWAAPAVPSDGYLLRYRAVTGTAWIATVGPIFALNRTITDLTPDTAYEFRVAAIGNGAIGPWSQPSPSATTRAHTPRYSDLIIWDGRSEVDVTRIQMLLFTIIAAGFVLLQIWRDNAIPDIPPGILILMGISNGVYLTAKFIPPQRASASPSG
jgi:Fibronectin type III domain